MIKSTNFQILVWKEITKIPVGKTITYKQLAKKIGFPNAYRAVGNACSKNPFLLVIPCHRVVTNNGKVGGYKGSKKNFEKIKILSHEIID